MPEFGPKYKPEQEPEQEQETQPEIQDPTNIEDQINNPELREKLLDQVKSFKRRKILGLFLEGQTAKEIIAIYFPQMSETAVYSAKDKAMKDIRNSQIYKDLKLAKFKKTGKL